MPVAHLTFRLLHGPRRPRKVITLESRTAAEPLSIPVGDNSDEEENRHC